MEIIKFDRVVSVNNELQGHTAQNILDGEISPNRNWMCEKGTEKAVVILQLERATILTSIHIGNAHSAFVEVLVGKAADSSDQFESLIPMSVFMNPQESKTGNNPNRTRLFNKPDFNQATASKSWDRIKVVCSQPFNKYVPYGLCFLKVHGEKEQKRAEALTKNEEKNVKKIEVLSKTEKKDEIEIGSFFKRKRTSAEDRTLSVAEQIKEAEKVGTLMKPSSHSIVKTLKEKKQERKSEEGTSKRQKNENVKERIEKDEKKADNKRKNEGGDEKTLKRKKEEKVKRKKKPFEKLMEDVVLVISGFKNPLRGDIRSMALEMGAKYSGDWESHCTHLVCAYDNTPKFHQVKGKGKIVKKDWVEKCHKDRRRYPWRRFALDKTDLKKPESEEEIDAGEESEPEEEPEEMVVRSSKSEAMEETSPRNSQSGDGDYDVATDEEDEKTVDTTDYPMPFLPDIFSQKIFYIEPNLESKAKLERYIVAYNGVITETFDENVDFYITDKGGAPVELFREKAPNLVAIKPSWIWEINSKQKCIPTTPHLVN